MLQLYKTFFAYSAIAVLIISCSAPESKNDQTRETSRKPNILFISIDDLGPNLGVYGNTHIVSPNIDALAEEGTTFLKTYSQVGVCAPSRASLMIGLRPDSTRVWHLGDKFREIMPEAVTMPQYFHKFGYYTVNMGKIFHNYMPDSVSWDVPDLRPPRYVRPEWLKRDGETFYVNEETQRKQKRKRDSIIKIKPNYYADGWNNGPAWEMEDVHDTMYYDGAQTKMAKKVLSGLAEDHQPFYFALGYFRPHLPFAVPKKYWDLYDRNELPLASNPYLPKNSPIMSMNSMYELRGYDGFAHIKHPSEFKMNEDTARILKQGYYASVSYIDAQVGKLMEHLRKLDILKNTIIIIWGDHGWKLGEHNGWCKQTNYNIDTHVPMIIRAPGQKNKGAKVKKLTELIDMFPSLCELSGIKVPEYLQGQSFVPLMNNPERKWKNAVFSQFHRRPRISPDGKRYMGYSMLTPKYHYVEWYYWNDESKEKGDWVVSELYDNEIDPDENNNIVKTVPKPLVDSLSAQLSRGWRGVKMTN